MNIEKYLILNKYLISLLGASDFRDLQEKLKDTPSGIDSDNRSHFINILRSSFDNIKISEDDLLRYDTNIQSYLKNINYRRDYVSLKYFQYLAVLFSEIVLDNLKNRKFEFIYKLNNFLTNYNNEQDIKLVNKFTEKDLRKFAFWMATGSGKTLIAHINYYQFFNYNLFSPDNIIFITPNEGLSKQHFEELQKSGIPSVIYSGSLNNGLKNDKEILVIEMTKFVEEKKGGGLTIPVYAFEGKNLVFVDEGHKGRKSEEQKWAILRDKLSENGFVFEYSATFGQILSEQNSQTLEEYAKSIIFDYSYKYFYLDGYGKDFIVLNIKNAEKIPEFSEVMFVGNLLSFYEQILVYDQNQNLAKEYNIEKPLWIFVGTTVTGKEEQSDVVQIVEFIKNIINGHLIDKWASKILNCKTEIKTENGTDIFEGRFKYLKDSGFNIDDLYKKLFGGKGELKIYELKSSEGEFGLAVSENNYFGVINIGDVSGFKKMLEKNGLQVLQDSISTSLFDDIKKENSKINILTGSKKFIEGWDTWRVSSMGLLNIGKAQGPQIIQLFGRGIRLKGKNMTLKRSGKNLPVKYLENLNIYGIKADYLNKFLDAIRKEEVEFETIEIPIQLQHKDKWESLYILTKKTDINFEEEEILKLKIDKRIYVTIDLTPKISIYLAQERKEGKEGIKTDDINPEVAQQRITEDIIDFLNWERIYQEVYEFKILRGYWNLVWDKDMLKNLLLSDRYGIYSISEILELKGFKDLTRIENIVILVIKKYLDIFYRKYAKLFELENLEYVQFDKQLPLFISENQDKYIVKIDKRERDLADKIKKLAKDLKKLQQDDEKTLPRIYFDKHLYVPILLKSNKIDKISPEGLVESEAKFVLGLKNYLKANKEKFSDIEIFLLRNLAKIGIGFQLQWNGFYPDFIMWLRDLDKQYIIFIDPHGLEHTRSLNNEKIKFAGFLTSDDPSDVITIKKIEEGLKNKNIKLESFIISPTKYEDLKKGEIRFPSKKEFENHHVLFLEDNNWIEKILSNLDIVSKFFI